MNFILHLKFKIGILIFILFFGLLAVFLVHNFDSIGQDIGRHLKTGEIIWQTKSVPATNLFSFTEPDFPFINHHWLSEVILFGVFDLGGFKGLILLKVFVILATFFLLLLTTLNVIKATFWPIVISFILSIFISISRTEVRPEIFSFFLLAFFMFVLFKAKYGENYAQIGQEDTKGIFVATKMPFVSSLWMLPLLELFWVNLHIYFFIGPLIFLFFLIDRVVNKKIPPAVNVGYVRNDRNEQFEHSEAIHQVKRSNNSNKLWLIFILIGLATLANPAGIHGALLPFNILKEYGYSIVENQTLAFLADFFGFDLPIFVFKLSAAVLGASFMLTAKKTKGRIFEILITAFFIYAGFKMLRNLPLYALVSFPIMAMLLTDVLQRFNLGNIEVKPQVRAIFKTTIVGFLVFMIYFVASGRYYEWARLSKEVGFSVPDGLERAVNFVKENNIKGPMFNNFDIGGYLIWKLPEEKVFVDNRPEAYSVEFFSEVYKLMQAEPEKWTEFSEKYGINFVFFGHTDATPWGQVFLKSIVRNSDWKVVFINENVIILVKNILKNESIFSKYKYELAE